MTANIATAPAFDIKASPASNSCEPARPIMVQVLDAQDMAGSLLHFVDALTMAAGNIQDNHENCAIVTLCMETQDRIAAINAMLAKLKASIMEAGQ